MRGATMGLMAGVFVAIAAAFLIGATYFYSKSGETDSSKCIEMINGAKAEMVSKVEYEKKVFDLNSRIDDLVSKQFEIARQGKEHYEQLLKEFNILTIRQSTMEKKQIEMKAGATRNVHLHLKTGDEPIEVSVVKPTKLPAKSTPLLKRSGVKQ